MAQIMWTKHFLKEKGVIIQGNIIYQDNKNAILLEKLEKNGENLLLVISATST